MNEKIRIVKERILNLTSNFPYTNEEINYLTIAYLCISFIDNDITDLLDEVLSKTYILFNDGCYNDLLVSLNADLTRGGGFCPLSLDKPGYGLIYINRFLFANMSNKPTKILEAIIHELKHAINSVVNYHLKQNMVCFGLCQETAHRKKGSMVEEAFNSYMTRLYLNGVNTLKSHFISNPNILRILNEIDVSKAQSYSYKCTLLLEPLFSDAKFFKLFYNAALFHDYTPLYKALNEVFGKNDDSDEVLDYLNYLLESYEENSDYDTYLYMKNKTRKLKKENYEIIPYFDDI